MAPFPRSGFPQHLEAVARVACAFVLNNVYHEHMFGLKYKIDRLEKSDRQCWRLNRELLGKKSIISNVPPLRDPDGE